MLLCTKSFSLHAVFVSGQVCVLVEVGRAGLELFELPELRETLAGYEADGPVEVLAGDWIGERLALAVALNAGVVAADVIERFGVDDVFASGVGDVFAAGTVTLLTADVPLGDLFGLDVVVDGVAAIAGWTGGAIEVAGAVERGPPVCAGFDVVGQPALFGDIPLDGFGVEVVSAPGEVALFEAAAIDEGDLLDAERAERIGVREVAEDGFGMLAGVADDVGHARVLPAVVGVDVAGFADLRTDEVRRYGRGWRLRRDAGLRG